jgi:hypothetical protein
MQTTEAIHAGFQITVYPIAFGIYRYFATNLKRHEQGRVEANDELEAIDKVMQMIDNDEV